MKRYLCLPAFLVAGVLAVGMAGGCKQLGLGGSSEKSLYDRLGGHDAIKAVVDDFTTRAAADPAVNFTRKGHPNEWKPSQDALVHFKMELVAFIEANTGGPTKYTGRSMSDVHKGMEITDAEFGALAADLGATLDKFNVPPKEKAELLGIVGSTKSQIVGK